MVHACLEAPESGVYYREKGEIVNSSFLTIKLHDYVSELPQDFTVKLTAIYAGTVKTYNATEVNDNKFRVFGENGKFFWHVHKKQYDITVEPFQKTL